MDLGRTVFEYGQTYVALSRVKSLDGLFLTSFDAGKIKANPKVVAFYEQFPSLSHEYMKNILQCHVTSSFSAGEGEEGEGEEEGGEVDEKREPNKVVLVGSISSSSRKHENVKKIHLHNSGHIMENRYDMQNNGADFHKYAYVDNDGGEGGQGGEGGGDSTSNMQKKIIKF
jgi:hypothetical protein